MEEAEKPKTKTLPWHPVLGVVFVLALYFVTQIVGGVLVSIYPALRHWSSARASDWLNSSIAAQFVYILLVESLTIGGLWWFLRRHRRGFRMLGLGGRPRWLDPVLAVAGFGVYFVLYLVAVGVVSHFVPSLNVNQPQDIGFSNAAGFLALAATFISLVVLPPVTEEILVRGFLFGTLRSRLSFLPAALLTSAIFGSGHLEGGDQGAPLLWIAFIDTFVLSLVLCYLREKTGKLWASMGLHMIKNGVAFVSLFLLHVH